MKNNQTSPLTAVALCFLRNEFPFFPIVFSISTCFHHSEHRSYKHWIERLNVSNKTVNMFSVYVRKFIFFSQFSIFPMGWWLVFRLIWLLFVLSITFLINQNQNPTWYAFQLTTQMKRNFRRWWRKQKNINDNQLEMAHWLISGTKTSLWHWNKTKIYIINNNMKYETVMMIGSHPKNTFTKL